MEHALPRTWSLCMTSENHGTVGPAGCAFSHAPEKHERVLVVEAPAGTRAPVAEFKGYVDGEPAVTWLDRENMPRVGTKLFAHAAANKAAEEGELPYGDALDTIAANAAREVGGIFTDSIPIKSLVVYARAVARQAIAADRAARPVANKAEVDLSQIDQARAVIRKYWTEGNWNEESTTSTGEIENALTILATPPATTGGANATPTGASTVLTDERIGQLYEEATSYALEDDDYAGVRALVRLVEREVAAQAGQVAVPEAVDGVRWDLFPGYLIDHCEGDLLSEEGLQHALASMLKDSQYLAAIAAAPSPGKESK